MSNNFKTARLQNQMKAVDVAEKIGVATSTISSWEAGRISPTQSNLIALADLYKVTVDYLLGRDGFWLIPDMGTKIRSTQTLFLLHGKPIQTKWGWALVNAIKKEVVLSDRKSISFSCLEGDMSVFSSTVEYNFHLGFPLKKEELIMRQYVFVEPIGENRTLLSQLRGQYTVYSREGFAENDKGHRFFLSSYGSDWLAYRE